jgi:hypothetical protein
LKKSFVEGHELSQQSPPHQKRKIMNDIQKLAISRLISETEDKKIRAEVPSGEHPVDFVVHFRGVVKVGEDYQKLATTSIPTLESLALTREVAVQGINELIARVDRGEVITRSDLEVIKTAGFLADDILVDCIQKAVDAKSGSSGSVIKLIPEIQAAVERVRDATSRRLGPQNAKGHVTTNIRAEEIGLSKSEVSAVILPTVQREAV